MTILTLWLTCCVVSLLVLLTLAHNAPVDDEGVWG